MEHKTDKFNFRTAIAKTKHVFIKDNQVLLKKDNYIPFSKNDNNEEWYPVNFQWIPVIELHKKI